jgi:hypothetical protein
MRFAAPFHKEKIAEMIFMTPSAFESVSCLSNAYRIAQTAGEERDVSEKIAVALQQFLSRCVFFATFTTLGAMSVDSFFRANGIAHASAIIFL